MKNAELIVDRLSRACQSQSVKVLRIVNKMKFLSVIINERPKALSVEESPIIGAAQRLSQTEKISNSKPFNHFGLASSN